MKSNTYKTLVALLLVSILTTLAGCQTVQQESAIEWLQRQPWTNL